MVDEESPPSSGSYASLFRQYIGRSVHMAQEQVAQSRSGLSDEERDQALHVFQFALDVPELWPETCNLLLALAPKLEQAGFRRDFVPFLEDGIAACQEKEDWATQAELECHQAMVLLAMGQMQDVRTLLTSSAQHAAAANDPQRQAAALNRQAFVERLQQHDVQAAALVAEARTLLTPGDSEWAYSNFVLGCLALDRSDWPAAQEYFQQSLEGWQRHDNQVMSARNLVNLGLVLRNSGQHEHAIAVFTSAIDLMTEIGDTANAAAARMNLGNVYLNLQRFPEAQEQYEQAEHVFRMTLDHLRLGKATLNLALIAMNQQQWEQARVKFAAALDLYHSLGDRRGAANALDGIAECYLVEARDIEAEQAASSALAELDGMEDHPGNAALLAHIRQHLHAARAGLKRLNSMANGVLAQDLGAGSPNGSG